MGNFYVENFTARCRSSCSGRVLRSDRRKAFVGPTLDGITVFYDEESDSQDDAAIQSLAKRSQRFRWSRSWCCSHVDDILCYSALQ